MAMYIRSMDQNALLLESCAPWCHRIWKETVGRTSEHSFSNTPDRDCNVWNSYREAHHRRRQNSPDLSGTLTFWKTVFIPKSTARLEQLLATLLNSTGGCKLLLHKKPLRLGRDWQQTQCQLSWWPPSTIVDSVWISHTRGWNVIYPYCHCIHP